MTDDNSLVVGQFLLDEISGKRFKVMLVEEVKQEPTDEVILQSISGLIGMEINGESLSLRDKSILLINKYIDVLNSYAAPEPYLYYWGYRQVDNTVVAITSKLDEYYVTSQPAVPAISKLAFNRAVERLGVDIFRIACGVVKNG